MRSFKLFDRRVGSFVAAAALVATTAIPSLALAAQLTSRSIELSSNAASATAVTYTVEFTPVANAGAFVLDFCTNTPLYGEDCTAPAGMTVVPATSATTNFTNVEALGADTDTNTLRVVGSMTASTPVSVDIAAVTNPSATGTVYARIVTFDTEANAEDYVSNPVEPAVNDGLVDSGSVALSINSSAAVSGAVLETMTFCVASQTITANCANAAANPPTLQLGRDLGDGVVALDTAEVSEGTLHMQISTNAVSGAVVNLKSSALNCGGLKLFGSADVNNCHIAAAGTDGISAGDAQFGVKTGTAAGVGGNANGTVRPFDGGSGAYYNSSTFKLFAETDNSAGVTSTYGDPFLDTNNAPANNIGMPITFGAQIANDTPAGRYSADLSMIATGRF